MNHRTQHDFVVVEAQEHHLRDQTRQRGANHAGVRDVTGSIVILFFVRSHSNLDGRDSGPNQACREQEMRE